jgi:putative lipoprotein
VPRCGGNDETTGNHDNFEMSNALLRIGLSGLLLLLLASVASGGGTDPNAGMTAATVTGSVSYRERIALPADALVVVQLRDVSRMDVAAKLISEQTIRPQHSVPIPFSLTYNSDEIDERMTYALFATIRGEGRLLFVTDRSYRVLTRGHPHHIDLILVQP